MHDAAPRMVHDAAPRMLSAAVGCHLLAPTSHANTLAEVMCARDAHAALNPSCSPQNPMLPFHPQRLACVPHTIEQRWSQKFQGRINGVDFDFKSYKAHWEALQVWQRCLRWSVREADRPHQSSVQGRGSKWTCARAFAAGPRHPAARHMPAAPP